MVLHVFYLIYTKKYIKNFFLDAFANFFLSMTISHMAYTLFTHVPPMFDFYIGAHITLK